MFDFLIMSDSSTESYINFTIFSNIAACVRLTPLLSPVVPEEQRIAATVFFPLIKFGGLKSKGRILNFCIKF